MVLQYDAQKNISAIALPSGAVQRYECDNLGRTVRLTNQRGGVTRLLYDSEDRVIATQRATGIVQQTSYDPEGQVVAVRNSARHIRIGYGHFRRPLWREEAGARLEFTYDTEGGVAEIFNESGERYAFLRDATGGLLAETGFDGRTRTYQRDRLGRASSVRLPSGRMTEFAYDSAGRVNEITHSDGTFVRFTHDPGGLVLTAENESARVEIERDTAGRILIERVNGREVRSRYDAGGHRVELSSSLGAHTRIDRDDLGEVRGLSFGEGRSLVDRPDVYFERDALGLERAREFSNGLRVEWDRDAAGRPTARRTWTRLDIDSLRSPGMRAALRDEREYSWDADERIASIAGPAAVRHYHYDARGRLVAEQGPGTNVVRRHALRA
jgi:YD repeat-containing protein